MMPLHKSIPPEGKGKLRTTSEPIDDACALSLTDMRFITENFKIFNKQMDRLDSHRDCAKEETRGNGGSCKLYQWGLRDYPNWEWNT